MKRLNISLIPNVSWREVDISVTLMPKFFRRFLVNAIKEYEDISDFNINTTYSRYYPAGDKKYFLQVSGNSIYF